MRFNKVIMINKIIKLLKRYQLRKSRNEELKKNQLVRKEFILNGSIPWSDGYHEYKVESIISAIQDSQLLKCFKDRNIPENFGIKLDERVVEYPWIFSKLEQGSQRILDAGSTFNFDYIVRNDALMDKDLTIYTYAPENVSFNKNRISYVYGDLRDLPFKNDLFDVVVSQSTIEHIDMDNSMYGYDIENKGNSKTKSYEYLQAISEMIRVLNKRGILLLTFPYGKFENHGFFQQFDEDMVDKILDLFKGKGSVTVDYLKYELEGWRFASKNEVKNSESYNPHSGKGKKEDFAAHSRSVACIEFNKN
jgi:SAM-dependent methyltransferase|tara:strand:- start:314963 stop:315880 length:918 start_codon:yes stop_codon:yes gene_type:complete